MTTAKKSNSRTEKKREPTPQEINHVIALFKVGRYAETEALAVKMTIRYPAYIFGWKALGKAIMHQGRNEDALSPLRMAAELSNEDALLHNDLGNALAKLGRLSEAEASYWQAINLNPDLAEARHNLGIVLRLGQISKAKKRADGIIHEQIDQSEADTGRFSNYLFIVGAQKAGTTSLYSYLDQRPELVGGNIKEKAFFSVDSLYIKGREYYHSLFPAGSKYACGMDATPSYFYYRESANRIYDFEPNAKIVALLREPVSRALSAFNMYHQLVGDESFGNLIQRSSPHTRDFFQSFIDKKAEFSLPYFLDYERQIMNRHQLIEEPSLVRCGLYAPQLERFINRFGRENVLILFSDDLKNDTHNTVNKVCAFMGLKPFSHREYPMQHVREYSVDQDGKELIRQFAGDLFAQDKLMLRQKFGIDVPW